MRNSLLVTSDLKSIILVDTRREFNCLTIGKRGVLLSVLGTELCASETPPELDNFIANQLKGIRAFYEFDATDVSKNQLCITYNEVNNAVFIIGITDITIEFTAPAEIPKTKVTTMAVKLKEKPEEGLSSRNVILARLETIGLKKFIRFYQLTAS
jgi:hypothetical protein